MTTPANPPIPPVETIVANVLADVNPLIQVLIPRVDLAQVDVNLELQVKNLVLQALKAADLLLRGQIVTRGAAAIGTALGGFLGTIAAAAVTAEIGGLGAVFGAPFFSAIGNVIGSAIGAAINNALDGVVITAENAWQQ